MAPSSVHNLRTDRAPPSRPCTASNARDASAEKALREYRDTVNLALTSAAELSAPG